MQNKKTAIITGASGAIGKAIARQLAENSLHVILVCRNFDKAKKTIEEISENVPEASLGVEIADLSRLVSIQELSTRIQTPVDILINNAADTPVRRIETPEGIEMQFAANVLNYFWMSLAFHRHLKQAAPSRIINVASQYAGSLDLNDLQFIKRHYNNDTAYRQSKQADRMLTVAFAEKLRADGISVNACHPGGVNSKLSNSMGFGGHETPDEGADTPVWLATADAGIKNTGKWFSGRKEIPCVFSRDKTAIDRLYETCLKFSTGLEII